MKIRLALPILAVSVFLMSGCVSAWITQTGKAVVEPGTRAEALAAHGAPIRQGRLAPNDAMQKRFYWSENGQYRQGGVASYEVYEYKGLMKDEEFGSGAATANAVTLGASEAISIPFALINRATGVAKRHLFFVGYNAAGKLVVFERMRE